MPTVTDARTVRGPSQALLVFMRQPSPRILAVQLVVLIRARMQVLADAGLASLTWWDLLIPVVILGVLWPVQEWVLHKYVLHLRPFELLGRRIDPYFAKKHRDHHAQPDYIPDIFLPARVIVPLIPVTVGFWWLLMPTPALALTAMIGYGGAALLYEWVHYLTHTSVTPSTRWFRKVRRNHRYHHYKNERYWYGFVLPQVDALFGTDPRPQDVETSATARNLGVELE
ncbi:MAG TPA: sterol desaturase family protein [Enhygromyxa sp.]|nr:sterol desaturase family protein [Enhygromyxa sp.]